MTEQTMQISSIHIALIALLLTAGAALWALFRLVTNSADNVRTELRAEVEKQSALASRSRHDMANAIQATIAKIETDMERLKRETVRREELVAIEQRLMTGLQKIETKMDVFVERIAALGGIERQMSRAEAGIEELRRNPSVKAPA